MGYIGATRKHYEVLPIGPVRVPEEELAEVTRAAKRRPPADPAPDEQPRTDEDPR